MGCRCLVVCSRRLKYGRLSGAFAHLYDLSRFIGQTELSTIQNDAQALWVTAMTQDPDDPIFVQLVESNFAITSLGSYSATVNNVDNDPTLKDPTVTIGDQNVVAKVTGDIASPDGQSDVDWLEMIAVSGNLASKVFQIHTVGKGQRPADESVGIS